LKDASYEALESHFKRYRRWKLIVVSLIVLLVITAIVSLSFGYAQVSFSKVVRILLSNIPFTGSLAEQTGVSANDRLIIIDLRLPRVLGSIIVGAALSTAGVVFQGILRNPMADPYVIGVSSGAALGAAIAIVLHLGFGAFGFTAVSLLAFGTSLGTVFLVYTLSRSGPRTSVVNLLLSGLAVTIFLSAVISTLQVIAGGDLHKLIFWLMGGFSYVTWREVGSVALMTVISVAGISLFSKDLNLLALGEDHASHLGVNVEWTKRVLVTLASLLTAAAVSISGLIGFVGLIIPHMARIVIGPDHRILLPASLLLGAIFLGLSDLASRLLFFPVDLPVGIITALCGGPFFIYLLRRKGASYKG